MADGSLYETDFHAWTIEQAAQLRIASSLRAPELDGIDFEHVIEEVEDLGREARNTVEGNWLQAMLHFMKIAVEPEAQSVNRWRKEINAFLSNARRRFRASMAQYIDLNDLWLDAAKDLNRDRRTDGLPQVDIPSDCPFSIDQLADRDYDLDDYISYVSDAFSTDNLSYR